jgi:hypothetical protein
MIPLSQLIRSTRYVGPEDPGHADVASGRGELGRRSLKRALALLFLIFKIEHKKLNNPVTSYSAKYIGFSRW